MELINVGNQRTGLLQFVVLLNILFSGLIIILAYQQVPGYSIPGLAVLSLLACLYVLSKERNLKKLELRLIRAIMEKDRKIDKLGKELEQEHLELEHEKGKAADLGGNLKDITAIYRAIRVVNADIGERKIIGTGLRAALDLVGGNRGSIMLMDTQNEHLYIVSALGLDSEVVRGTKQKVGQGVAGWVAQYGQPILLHGEAGDDKRFIDPTALAGKVNCAMSVPLKLGSEIIGVMNLGSTDEKYEFSDHHMRLATIFGQHVSIPIVNALLLKGQKESAPWLAKTGSSN